jgi:hypothetical protein
MSIKRRVIGLAFAISILGISGGAGPSLISAAHTGSVKHVAGCSTCPRPPEQPY